MQLWQGHQCFLEWLQISEGRRGQAVKRSRQRRYKRQQQQQGWQAEAVESRLSVIHADRKGTQPRTVQIGKKSNHSSFKIFFQFSISMHFELIKRDLELFSL
jgi:hypothetical protein